MSMEENYVRFFITALIFFLLIAEHKVATVNRPLNMSMSDIEEESITLCHRWILFSTFFLREMLLVKKDRKNVECCSPRSQNRRKAQPAQPLGEKCKKKADSRARGVRTCVGFEYLPFSTQIFKNNLFKKFLKSFFHCEQHFLRRRAELQELIEKVWSAFRKSQMLNEADAHIDACQTSDSKAIWATFTRHWFAALEVQSWGLEPAANTGFHGLTYGNPVASPSPPAVHYWWWDSCSHSSVVLHSISS